MYTETRKQKKKQLATLMMDYHLLAPEPMQVGKSKYHVEGGVE
jgi:hypothetical protein